MNKSNYTRLTDLFGCQNPSDTTLYREQGGRCAICGSCMAPHSFRNHNGGFTAEHVFAHRAGNGLFANKVLTCRDCNVRKGATAPDPELVSLTRTLYERLMPAHVIAALRAHHHPVWTSA